VADKPTVTTKESAGPAESVAALIQDQDRNTEQFKKTLRYLLGKSPESTLNQKAADTAIANLKKAYTALKEFQKLQKKSKDLVPPAAGPTPLPGIEVDRMLSDIAESKRYMKKVNEKDNLERQEHLARDSAFQLAKLEAQLGGARYSLNTLREACAKLQSESVDTPITGIRSFLKALHQAFTVTGDLSLAMEVSRMDTALRYMPQGDKDQRLMWEGLEKFFYQAIDAIGKLIGDTAVKMRAYIENTKLELGNPGYREDVHTRAWQAAKAAPGQLKESITRPRNRNTGPAEDDEGKHTNEETHTHIPKNPPAQ
jgi:hypothetical protein